MRTILGWLMVGILGASAAWAAAQTPATLNAPVPLGMRNAHMGTTTHFAQGWDVGTVMPLIAASGLGWIRDEIYWSEVEKSQGVYQIPERTTKWVEAAHQAGLKVILCMDSRAPFYKGLYDPAAYAAAAAYIAKELAGKAQAIEVLNEPYNDGYGKDYGGTWNGREADGSNSPWLAKYVTLLNTTAKAVKAANPKMKVIGLGSVDPANFRQIALGIAPEVAGITDHPYSFNTMAEIVPFNSSPAIMQRDGIATADAQGTFASQMRMYREQCAKYKGPKEIWLTEWGWTNCSSSVTERVQAKYIMRRFMECLGLGVDVSIQYDFKEDAFAPDDAEQNLGLMDANLKPKPSYAATRRLAIAMAGCQVKKNPEFKVFPVTDRPDQGPIVEHDSQLAAPGTIACYQFVNAKGQPLLALWSAEQADGDLRHRRTAQVEITTQSPVTAIQGLDLWTGEAFTVPFESQGNQISIQQLAIPDYPITLTFE